MSGRLLGTDADEVLDGDFVDISELQGDIDAQLDAVIGEFAGEREVDAKIKVYRIEKGKRNWCFDCIPEELPILDRVRDVYGPGDYLSRLYIGGKLNKGLPFSIAAPRNPFNGNQQSTKNTGDVASLADVIKQGMDGMRDLIAQNNQQQQPPNMMEMQTHFMTQMAAMKEMFGSNEQKNSGIKDLKEMFLLVEMLRGENQPSEPKGVMDVLGSLVDKALPALSKAAEMGDNPRLENPSKRPSQRQQTQSQQEKPGMALKMQLAFLCSMAAQNADPATYAGLIIDQCNPEQLAQLVALLGGDDWLERLAQSHRPVLEHEAWLLEVRGLILEEVNGDEGEQTGELDNGETGNDNPEEIPPEIEDDVPTTGTHENDDNP